MIRNIIHFFDKLEDRIRHRLSQHPTLYALIGGVGVVLFWRGVWDLADIVPGLSPLITIGVSLVIMLLTGTFVSFFIGEQIIISGLKAEKRIDEKTEDEVRKEEIELVHLDNDIEAIRREVTEIRRIIDGAKL